MLIPIRPSLPQPSTALYLGRHLLQSDLIASLCIQEGNRVAILADSALKESYAMPLAQKLQAELFLVPQGERAKTQAVQRKMEEQLLQAGYGRDTVLIGLGGGATTDLAGFIASTYLRGIPLILIPTSLLAMVDASIGGKTAIDTVFGKNLIGTFYPPKAIIADLETLKTLPPKEFSHGLAEILKMGLIFDPSILQLADFLENLVEKAMRAKISLVEQDFSEQGLRRILNFGHTIGHALETVSRYTLPHGEAVAIGCLVESYLSFQLSYLSKEEFGQIEALYQRSFDSFRLPAAYQRKEFLEALLFDKKKRNGKVRFVCIDRIGHALSFEGDYCRTVADKDLAEAISYMEKIACRS